MWNRSLSLAGLLVMALGVSVWWDSSSEAQEAASPPVPPGATESQVPSTQSSPYILNYAGYSESSQPNSAQDKLRRRDQALEQATKKFLAAYREKESTKDRVAARQKLEETVDEHFDVRQKIREEELVELEKRVKKLRELHEKRAEAREEIVARRVELLVRDAEGLGWGSPSAAGQMIDRRNDYYYYGGRR